MRTRAASARLGVISDTHGLVRAQALEALRGVDLILHAGDIGGAGVLETLAKIAPVTAVRGNNDTGAWAASLPETRLIELHGWRLYLLHDLKTLSIDPVTAAIDIVVAGHSHRPSIKEDGGRLYLNPGSAGPRRFNLPISVAHVHLNARAQAEIVMLAA